MTSGPGNYDEDVVVLEDSNDSFTMSDEQNNHRVILESHSFIEAGNIADDNRGPEQPHYRAARVIWSSDEETDDDNVTKKRRRKPSDNGDVGDHICFEFKIAIMHCLTSNGGIEDDETNSCSICFEAYTASGSHRIVCLKCGHLFGQSCIERWIRTEKVGKCPQCKAKARLTDIRRLYVRAIKALDTTELECLKQVNNAYRAENDSLRVENQRLKEKIIKDGKHNPYKVEMERLSIENAQLKAKIAVQEKLASKLRSTAPPAAKMMKGAYFSLLAGPTLHLSSEPGSRSLDANGEYFVVACKVRNDLFMPYGLKLITAGGRDDTVIPVHSRKPRCCKFSPFDYHIVLSTGEDHTLCVTSFDEHPRVQHRIPLPSSGWCCCWLSESDVAVGLINGRVLKFNLYNPAVEPLDITFLSGHLPIISLQFCAKKSLLFVTSLKECILYHHMQPHVLISDQGSINSFCYDQESGNVMLTFAPSQQHETVTHVLYSLDLNSEQKKVHHIHTYRSLSKKLTRVIKNAFWTTPYGQLAAVYDESNSHVVLYDWNRKCPVVMKRINDIIVDIKEIVTSDMQKFQLGCLSETTLYFLEAQY
ncbi:Ring finger domain family protein [Brugia pahangi]